MVAATLEQQAYEEVIQLWKQLPTAYTYTEQNLELNFVQPLLLSLGLEINQIKADINLGKKAGLKPDRLIYTDLNKPPVLVIEIKKRVPELANASEQEFFEICQQPNSLYREAIGYPNTPSNGIKQYLDKSNPNIMPERLASYGLVFNGDFFQLWRRVDGLILPLTPIQRVTESSIPELMKQLEYCLYSRPKALVTSIWNRKGGVAKTTNTLNLSSVLALQGKKVLLIDLDTQNDLTRALRLNPDDYSEYLEECLREIQARRLETAKDILQNTIQTCQYPTTDGQSFSLSILPANEQSQKNLRNRSGRDYDRNEKIRLLQQMIKLFVKEYDYIFIDTSPADDVFTLATLFACDTVLITSDYSRKTLHHAVELYNMSIPNIRKDRAKRETLYLGPWNLGLLFSNCPSGTMKLLEECIQNELNQKGFTGKQYQNRLKIYAQTKLAEYKKIPVICWQKSPITKLYNQLADEVFLTHNFIDC